MVPRVLAVSDRRRCAPPRHSCGSAASPSGVTWRCAARRLSPQGLAGLCLFAPYLGSHIIISEVAQAGIRAWRAGDLADDDDERRVWRFLQRREAATLPLHLGLGREDRFLNASSCSPMPWTRLKSIWCPVDTTGPRGCDSGEFSRCPHRCPPLRIIHRKLATFRPGAGLHCAARRRGRRGSGAPATLGRGRSAQCWLNHLLLCAAGLWPRSRLLGRNLTAPAGHRARRSPSRSTTARIRTSRRAVLALLEAQHAKATFFVRGRAGAAASAARPRDHQPRA